MPNLIKLKMRLEKLPELENEQKLAAIFRHYTQKVRSSHDQLGKAKSDMGNIVKVFPNSECKKIISQLCNSSIKIAQNLYKEIENDPWSIQKNKTERLFVKLAENTKASTIKCEAIWNAEITERIENWEKIAGVVQKLNVKGGQIFKQAFDRLKSYSNKVPQNDTEALQIKKALNTLQQGIANLGLKGPFGNFLKCAVEGGASPKDLLANDVREKIDEHELWDAFLVLLKQ